MGSLRLWNRKPQRMMDGPGLHLFIPHQAREDCHPRSIGRRLAIVPKSVAGHVIADTRCRLPRAAGQLLPMTARYSRGIVIGIMNAIVNTLMNVIVNGIAQPSRY